VNGSCVLTTTIGRHVEYSGSSATYSIQSTAPAMRGRHVIVVPQPKNNRTILNVIEIRTVAGSHGHQIVAAYNDAIQVHGASTNPLYSSKHCYKLTISNYSVQPLHLLRLMLKHLCCLCIEHHQDAASKRSSKVNMVVASDRTFQNANGAPMGFIYIFYRRLRP
jgi:hypothetical protein